MSFYLDSYPDEDPTEICPHCSSRDFYTDPISGTLTCSSCYTQSQSQHEEIDIEDGMGLVALQGKRRKIGASVVKKVMKRDISEYDESRKLPDVESCCLAFQWLLLDASRCVAALAGISEDRDEFTQYDSSTHSILEVTVKNIWFSYLHAWTEASQSYSSKYPEMRVSFRDLFLSEVRRSVISRHLSVTVGKRVEDEMIHDIQTKLQSNDGDCDNSMSSLDGISKNGDVSSKSSNTPCGGSSKENTRKRKRRPILSVTKICPPSFKSPSSQDRLPNGCYLIDPNNAVLQIQPSLTLLLSILQLALMHLKTGHAAYHLTSWVANGSLPHALNGYCLLPSKLRERVFMVKKFFVRSFVPTAAAVDDLMFLLAASIGWLEHSSLQCGDKDEKGSSVAARSVSSQKQQSCDNFQLNQDSQYNVPVLAARMVQDLGFGQKVLDNALALMGLRPGNDEHSKTPNTNRSLMAASPEKLFTPLHIAAVLVVACKLCQGWESWRIHSLPNNKFVPWNDSQIDLLGNGPRLDHYIDFLKNTAFNTLDCSAKVGQFFQSLDEDVAQSETMQDGVKPVSKPPQIEPNVVLSGAPNPNNEPLYHRFALLSNKEENTSSERCKGGLDGYKICNPLNSNYSQLIEFVCYTIEETNPAKLHELVIILEDELLKC